MKMIYALVLCLLFGGCTIFSKTAREEKRDEKAEQKLRKIHKNRPDVFINTVLDLIPPAPPVTVTDSTEYKEWKAKYDSLRLAIPDTVTYTNWDTIYRPDSVRVKMLQQDLNVCHADSRKKDKAIQNLQWAIDNFKPVKDTVYREETRRLDSLHQAHLKEKSVWVKETTTITKKLNKSNNWKTGGWSVAGALFLLLALAIYFLIKEKKSKVTKQV